MQSVLAAVPEPAKAPAKKRGSRKAWTLERFEVLCRALAHSAKQFGASYTRTLKPSEVPRDAPDSSEWNGIAAKILALVPEYGKVLEAKAKLTKSEKTHNGGLDQYVYLDADAANFLNNSGILGPFKVPIEPNSGGLGIITRTNFTSFIVSYLEAHGLKHPEEKKYNMRDANLKTLITDADMETLKTLKPKKKKKPAKEGAKPKKEHPKIKILIRNGEEVAHFNFDVIPSIAGMHILPLIPRAVTDEQKAAVQAIRTHLASLTAARSKVREAQAAEKKATKKTQEVQKSIVNTQVLTLSLNPNYQAPVPNGLPGAPQQAIPAYQVGLPPGVTAVPGVTFVQPGLPTQ